MVFTKLQTRPHISVAATGQSADPSRRPAILHEITCKTSEDPDAYILPNPWLWCSLCHQQAKYNCVKLHGMELSLQIQLPVAKRKEVQNEVTSKVGCESRMFTELRVTELRLQSARPEDLHILSSWTELRKLDVEIDWTDSTAPLVLPPCLETLKIRILFKHHLECIAKLTTLKHLDLWCRAWWDDAPELPLQLETLRVRNVSLPHLRSVQRMSQLRSLELVEYCGPQQEFRKLSPQPSGLRRLAVSAKPKYLSTFASLIKAHGASLEVLEFRCDTRKTEPYHFSDLAGTLKGSDLESLRSLLLVRNTQTRDCPHSMRLCERQLKWIARHLSPEVILTCNECPNKVKGGSSQKT